MGITQQIGASSLIKPGVIDNTAARPASPYEGQVIFQKDTDQLLVWNGTAWVIPNSPAQNPQGLELIKTQTIGTTVSSVTVSDVFSSTYDNYRVIVSSVSCSANQPSLRMRLGSTITDYSWAGFDISYVLASLNAAASSATTYWYIGNFGNATSMSSQVDILRPNLAENTNYSATSGSTNWSILQNGYLNNTTSYTSFNILPGSGTMTGGTIRVYGYRNS